MNARAVFNRVPAALRSIFTRPRSAPTAELSHSEEDRERIEAQLGRPVRGQWRVARRCHLGVPMVIENHPRLEDGVPFPTLFWLTCPVLTKRAARLEAGGFMSELNDELSAKEAMRARQAHSIERYLARRDSLEPIADSGSPPGGDADRIKCLHAVVAHELSDPPNPAGARGLAATGYPDCRTGCVETP